MKNNIENRTTYCENSVYEFQDTYSELGYSVEEGGRTLFDLYTINRLLSKWKLA